MGVIMTMNGHNIHLQSRTTFRKQIHKNEDIEPVHVERHDIIDPEENNMEKAILEYAQNKHDLSNAKERILELEEELVSLRNKTNTVVVRLTDQVEFLKKELDQASRMRDEYKAHSSALTSQLTDLERITESNANLVRSIVGDAKKIGELAILATRANITKALENELDIN